MSQTYSDDGSEQIDCPWCGRTIGDLWDHRWRDDEACSDCPHCEESVILTREVSVVYTAKRMKP